LRFLSQKNISNLNSLVRSIQCLNYRNCFYEGAGVKPLEEEKKNISQFCPTLSRWPMLPKIPNGRPDTRLQAPDWLLASYQVKAGIRQKPTSIRAGRYGPGTIYFIRPLAMREAQFRQTQSQSSVPVR
jgi:hypothetical protein